VARRFFDSYDDGGNPFHVIKSFHHGEQVKIINGRTLLATAVSIALVAPNISMAACMNHNAETALKVPIPNPAGNVLGTTQAEIHARFAGVVEQNFRTGNMNKIVHNLSARELADLAAVYKNATSTPSVLLQIVAKGVDADGLASVASAFGQEETAAAVAHYAPAVVANAFAQLPVKNAAERSVQLSEALTAARATGGAENPDAPTGGGGPPGTKGPNLGMTPYEIYLEFRTAPFGADSALVALYESSQYMGGSVGLVWKGATTVGQAVSGLIQTYDPTLDDAIGGTVSNMISQIGTAATELAQGQIEAAWDSLFAIPKVSSSTTVPLPTTSFGDFGVTFSMADYTDTGGTLPSNAAGGSASTIVAGGC
jgi:cytochrome c553